MHRETGLGEKTSASMRPGSGSQSLPSSHLGLGSPKGQGWPGLPLATWALLLGCWSRVGTQLQPCSPSVGRLIVHEKALSAQAPKPPPQPAGR